MKPYLIVDEGVLRERNYRHLVKIWGHPRLVKGLVSAFGSDGDFCFIDSITCKNGVYLEVYLHPLAGEGDITSLQTFVRAFWDELRRTFAAEEEIRSIDDWIPSDIDTDIGDGTLTGVGKAMRTVVERKGEAILRRVSRAVDNVEEVASREEEPCPEDAGPVSDSDEASCASEPEDKE